MTLHFRLRIIGTILLSCVGYCSIYAQCPPNIGFENGDFTNWECSIGTISGLDGSITLAVTPGPVIQRQTLIKNSVPQLLDPYGSFPKNCPNGSGYSIQLGNDQTGRQAERVSYTFTIPSNDNNYSIIYNYAVVFQNPKHEIWQQPKFTANVYDVTADKYIDCSSFNYAASAGLPGFKMGADSVFYKPWTPVTIKLSGYAGKTIRLEFTTNDCTIGGHFGYAYVDVNENCSTPVTGNTQCINDSSQTLTAPYGFARYRWFNETFTQVLSTNQTLTLAPIPKPGTKFAVEVIPFQDQGCQDTVYTTITFSNEVLNLQVPNTPIQSCIADPVDLTAPSITSGSSPNLSFTYFSDSTLNNYVLSASQISTSGKYYIKAQNSSGCSALKAVNIQIFGNPNITISDPPAANLPNAVDLSTAISGNTTGLTFTYWKDSLLTIPVSNPNAIDKNGTYYIKATNVIGCAVSYAVNVVINDAIITPPNAFSPNNDGIHDTWEIPLLYLYPDCVVEIYNRQGQIVFNSIGYSKSWDGRFNGIDQPVATYYYVIRLRPEIKPFGGSVTIIR